MTFQQMRERSTPCRSQCLRALDILSRPRKTSIYRLFPIQPRAAHTPRKYINYILMHSASQRKTANAANHQTRFICRRRPMLNSLCTERCGRSAKFASVRRVAGQRRPSLYSDRLGFVDWPALPEILVRTDFLAAAQHHCHRLEPTAALGQSFIDQARWDINRCSSRRS